MSTVVAPWPVHAPPSITRSTRPSIIPKTSMPLRHVGWPEMLALVEISGSFNRSMSKLRIFERDWRSAMRPVLPVTFRGIFAEAGTMMVSGPGQKRRASRKKRLFSSPASSSAITMSRTRMGSERCSSRPFALKACVTARRLKGSATSVYSASLGMATTLPRRTAAAACSRTSGWGSSGLISTRSVAIFDAISARADSLRDVQGHLVAAERSTQLNALHHLADPHHHFAGDGNSFLASLIGIVHPAHPLHEFLRHGHSQFVDHELRVAVAGEGPDAANYWDLDALDALEKSLQVIQIENRLRHHVLGAGFYFPLEAADLLVHVEGARVGPHADQQGRLRSHGVTANVQPVVEVPYDVDQPDGVHIEDRGGIRIRPHARRIAGDADQVAHPGRMGAEQFRLDPQDIAVAAAEVVHGFNSGMLLDQLTGHLRAHAGAGAGAVGDIDAIDAVFGRAPGALDLARSVNAARRQNFDKRDELAFRQLGAQLGFRSHRHGRQRVGLRLRLLHRDGQPLLQRLERARLRADQLDVLRGSAAAAADHLDARPQQPARILRHVLGRAEIHIAAFDPHG